MVGFNFIIIGLVYLFISHLHL